MAATSWMTAVMGTGNIDGVQLGMDGGKLADGEAFFGRKYWIQDGFDGPSARATFSPDGKNAAGQQTGELPVTDARWKQFFLDPMNGVGNDTTHPLDCFPSILGIRGGDATWPGHAAIRDWVVGGKGQMDKFIDKAVADWARLMKMTPRYTFFRLWHEHGNGVYSSTDWNLFKANWNKIGRELRDHYGAISDDVNAANAGGLAWNPASHPASPSDDLKSFPGCEFVQAIGRDIYNKVGSTPVKSWGDGGDAWVQTFHPDGRKANTMKRPLIVFESGIQASDPQRLAKLDELNARLVPGGKWDCISGWIWWNGAGNELADKPAGFQAKYKSLFSTAYYLPDGKYADNSAEIARLKVLLVGAQSTLALAQGTYDAAVVKSEAAQAAVLAAQAEENQAASDVDSAQAVVDDLEAQIAALS